jgi:hypothetical protein
LQELAVQAGPQLAELAAQENALKRQIDINRVWIRSCLECCPRKLANQTRDERNAAVLDEAKSLSDVDYRRMQSLLLQYWQSLLAPPRDRPLLLAYQNQEFEDKEDPALSWLDRLAPGNRLLYIILKIRELARDVPEANPLYSLVLRQTSTHGTFPITNAFLELLGDHPELKDHLLKTPTEAFLREVANQTTPSRKRKVEQGEESPRGGAAGAAAAAAAAAGGRQYVRARRDEPSPGSPAAPSPGSRGSGGGGVAAGGGEGGGAEARQVRARRESREEASFLEAGVRAALLQQEEDAAAESKAEAQFPFPPVVRLSMPPPPARPVVGRPVASSPRGGAASSSSSASSSPSPSPSPSLPSTRRYLPAHRQSFSGRPPPRTAEQSEADVEEDQ